MSIFNSLGSNYGSGTGVYSLRSSPSALENLKSYLTNRYKSVTTYPCYKGREAIALILKNLNLPAGSYVAINGYTCYAVYQSIVAAGLKPYYLDIAKDGANFTVFELEAALKKELSIRAVIIQNTFGIACDIDPIKRICNQNKLFLIEDLAHSVGLIYPSGGEAGTVGDATALSFSQDKVLDGITGGAAVFKTVGTIKTDYSKAALSHRAKTHLYPWLTLIIRKTFQVGVGRIVLRLARSMKLLPGAMSGDASKLHYLPNWHSQAALSAYQNLAITIEHRQKIADIYRKNLPIPIQLEHVPGAIYLRFPIRVQNPSYLISYLRGYNFHLTDRWYDAPVAPSRFLKQTDYQIGQCPYAEQLAEQVVNLPTHININEEQAKILAGKVTQWLK